MTAKSALVALRFRIAELRALRLDDVRLCRQIRFHGFEHVHTAREDGRELLFLLSDLGSIRVGRRVLEVFWPQAQVQVLLGESTRVESVRRARSTGAAVVWAKAEPAAGGRWEISFSG